VFVALMHNLVEQLRPALAAERPVPVGQPLLVRIPAGDAPLAATSPSNRRVPVQVSPSQAGGAIVQLPPATEPGFYRITAGPQTVAIVAVNIDERESDLARAAPPTLDAAGEVRIATAAGPGPGPGVADAFERDGLPLWPLLVLATMVVIAGELAIVAAWKR
jgi:hypothetical protein